MTAYAEIPMTAEISRAIDEQYGVTLPLELASRLPGGEEPAAYQVGDHIVRIGPAGRRHAGCVDPSSVSAPPSGPTAVLLTS